MSDKYDAYAWILDALTTTETIGCMPPDMIEIIKDSTKCLNVDFNELLNDMRRQITEQNKTGELGMYNSMFTGSRPRS